MTDLVKVLSDDEVDRIQQLPVTMNGNIKPQPGVVLTAQDRNALCASVRALSASLSKANEIVEEAVHTNTVLRERLAQCHDERWASQRLLTETQERDSDEEEYLSRGAWLREGLLAARDALVPIQHEAGRLPYQDGYSATMTPVELQLSKIVAQIDKLLLKDEELAGLRKEQP